MKKDAQTPEIKEELTQKEQIKLELNDLAEKVEIDTKNNQLKADDISKLTNLIRKANRATVSTGYATGVRNNANIQFYSPKKQKEPDATTL